MTFIPVALSLVATFESSILMLGSPAESYVYGISWMWGELGSVAGHMLEMSVVLIFLRRLDLSTPYEVH